MEANAYLFTHFKGCQKNPDDEQVYFAVSKDGETWENINGGKPVLYSRLGEKGIRDPHIIRRNDEKGFFLIATDLYVYGKWGDNPDGWYRCQREGSNCIMVWESEDLVNWSEQRMVKPGLDDASCVWAPECIYDDEKDDYFVYWSSRRKSDNNAKQRVYCAHTKDFISFTEPKLYIERDFNVIDTSMIKASGKYYRLTKNHENASIFMEAGETPDGEFYEIKSFSMKDKIGYEGPTMYKICGKNEWCMLLDAYAYNEGYKAYVTDDLESGRFAEINSFKTPDVFRHGTVLPITEKEYDRLISVYGNNI